MIVSGLSISYASCVTNASKALRITIAVLVSDLATGISLKNGNLFTIYLSRREFGKQKLSGPEAT
jgi:hypothetical protein